MLLLREIYGWLRYSIGRDPLLSQQGIRVEEVLAPLSVTHHVNTDATTRTLVISRPDDLSRRIEVRFTGLRPQIWWFDGGAGEGKLVHVTQSAGFPGDATAWDCSDTVEYLVALAKARLCECHESMLLLLPPPTTASAKVPLPSIQRILTAARRAQESGKQLTRRRVEAYLRDELNATLGDLHVSCVEAFRRDQLKWADIDQLEGHFQPGSDILDWRSIKASFHDPELRAKLPTAVLEDVVTPTEFIAPHLVKARLDRLAATYIDGEQPVLADSAVRLGRSVVHHIKTGTLAFSYMPLMQRCDLHERLLPWSLIRRSVLAYRVEAEAGPLEDQIVAWLSSNHLMPGLYGDDSKQQTDVVRRRIATVAHQTLDNPAWVKQVLQDVVANDQLDTSRALQTEFDQWLYGALRPSVGAQLPWSPDSLANDPQRYGQIQAAWQDRLKTVWRAQHAQSVQTLARALRDFYQEVAQWKPEDLGQYHPKVPPSDLITAVARRQDHQGLLNLLLEDVEAETGAPVPDDTREKLLASPCFNTIFDETRVQSLAL